MAGSFESVDFSVRKNKNIQRKLIVDFLEVLGKEFDLLGYQYIGMGSLWFVDFVLFHKRLGLHDMVSIQEHRGYARAQFNVPFRCVRVRRGLTSDVLPTLKLDRQLLVWLDYDEQLKSSICDDLDVVSKRARSGSLLFATVRGELKDFGGKSASDKVVEQSLRQELGPWLPAALSAGSFAVETFPSRVGAILHAIVGNLCAGRFDGHRWVPVLTYYYNDGTRMTTIGGMICDSNDQKRLKALRALGRGFYRGVQTVHIDAPQLTPREKVSIDTMLPVSEEELRKSKLARGLKGVAREYAKYYRHYPVFWELTP